MEKYDNLNETQMDVLREVGNIGGGNAATALASLLTNKVDMTVPSLSVISVSEIAQILGGPENQAVGIVLTMADDVSGMLMYILDMHFTRLLLGSLLGREIESFESIDEMDLSALKEIGNILAGSYINAISSLTGLKIKISTPQIAIDMVGAMLNYPAARFGEMGDRLLYIEEDFLSGANSIKSHLLIMPEYDSLEVILKNLGAV